MALEVASAAGERILAAPGRGGDRFRRRQILVQVERARFEAATVHVPHAVDRKQDVGAKLFWCACRIGFEPGDDLVEVFVERDVQRGPAEARAVVADLRGQRVGAVRHVADVELDCKRRLEEIARDAVEDAEILHELAGLRRSTALRRRRAFTEEHVRSQVVSQLDRRHVNLLES